jgi:hypothetical protein
MECCHGSDSLVTEDTDAGAEFVRGFHSYMPVEAAFWIRPVDDGRWTLCIVSKGIDEKTYDIGYGEVLRLIQEMKEKKRLYINPIQVRLLQGDDPLALAVEIHRLDIRGIWQRALVARNLVRLPSRARTLIPLRSSHRRIDRKVPDLPGHTACDGR